MSERAAECERIKKAYDACFNAWYREKFLKGDVTPACRVEFDEWKGCLMVTRWALELTP
jgi:TRIAP1/MDM35 family protein